MGGVSLDQTREFWGRSPVGFRPEGFATFYDYLRTFDNLREATDCEPYAFSELVHGYESSAGADVLDYGCGNGYVLAHYARNGARVTGVDIADTAVGLSRARFELLGLEGAFQRTDGTTLPFSDESFDIVCSIGVLHHIPAPERVVAELHRVLRPGGRLVVMVYNRNSYRYQVVFRARSRFGPAPYRGRSLQELVNMNDGADNPLGRVYTHAQLRRMLAAFEGHEFHVRKLDAAEIALWHPRLQLLARLLPATAVAALGRRAGWNLYCVARKPGRG